MIKRCERRSAAGKGRCTEYEHYIANCIKVRTLYIIAVHALISRPYDFLDTMSCMYTIEFLPLYVRCCCLWV